MSRLALVLVAVAILFPGCCMGGSSGPTTQQTAPPLAVPAAVPMGSGVLPNPPPLFAGVDAPYPIPGAAPGVEGYILRSGSATAQIVSGLAGVTQGTQCSYTQYQITHSTTLDCRWNVTCGGYVLYGLGNGGYQRCNDPMWPAGTLMFDPNTSGADTDPMFIFNAGGISIGDDALGRNGAFSATLTVP
jgi:hypothetical protein